MFAAIAGCGGPAAPTSAAAPKAVGGADQVNRIVERYWDDRLPADEAIAPQYLADSLSVERRYLAEILAVPRDALDSKTRLTYDIFRRQREVTIEGFTYPTELLPIDPIDGMPLLIAAYAAELAVRPSIKAADYENWLKRIDDYVRWTQQAALNMREGLRRGYTSPRALIERILPLLERLGMDDPANVFYGPLRSLPDGIQASNRAKLTRELTGAVSQKLLPANRALHDFLLKEYLPRARNSLALSDLPLGSQWYAYRVRRATSSTLSPEEINRIGTAEVERLGAPSAREAPAAPANGLLNAYRELQTQIQAALPTAFAETPTEEFDIRSVDWLPQPGLALHYQPRGASGSPPAVLYVNTAKGARAAPSIAAFLQQALPGLHFQSALQQERTDLPRFRRFGIEPAFTEGWGLYAVSLGETLGIYTDESARIDAASTQMRCAVSLVVDTSLQVKGWTRAQAFDYLRVHLSIDDLDAQLLIDSYAARPGDALACVGEARIRALRTRAQQLLGGRFDLRDFHKEILRDGSMPLDILEIKIKAWMDALK
jgi:uncharacterized protein (DUF885 family)